MIEKQYPKEFYTLKTNIKKLLNFNTEQYKNTYLGRRFDSRLRVYHLDSYDEYWQMLKNDKNEQKILLKELTINVTEFFRDNTVYQAFKDQVIPHLLENNKNNKIRIWSAGSSDGKEAYSIAMIFSEIFRKHNVKNKVEIIGTDIDHDCLKIAKNAEYLSKPGIHQVDVERQLKFFKNAKKYFDIQGNLYKVKPELKQLTSFRYHDLISGMKKRGYDVIFCRNVVIYFTRELQEILYKDFYNALKKGGFFVMGKTETLVGETRDLFTPFNTKERIFVKK